MEHICKNFHQYDFQNDPKFNTGWGQISENIPEHQKEQEMLKAKLFYFTRCQKFHRASILDRCFHPISEEEYSAWLASKSVAGQLQTPVVDYSHPLVYTSQIQTNSSSVAIGSENFSGMDMNIVCVDGLSKLNIDENIFVHEISDINDTQSGSQSTLPTNTESAVMEGLSGGSMAGEDTAEPKYPLSFYDLMWIIEKGEKLPGVEELNIEPTNENPTASNICRRKKPWEN